MKNVEVCTSDGLLVEFARKNGIKVIIKGLRAVTDFDYEFKMALMNKKLDPEIRNCFYDYWPKILVFKFQSGQRGCILRCVRSRACPA